MKIILAILISVIFFGGCSTINYVNSPGESKKDYSLINNLGARNSSHIILIDKRELWRDYIQVKDDSLFYGLNESNLNSIPLSKVNKVFIKDKPLSFGGALLTGIGTGIQQDLFSICISQTNPVMQVLVFSGWGFLQHRLDL